VFFECAVCHCSGNLLKSQAFLQRIAAGSCPSQSSHHCIATEPLPNIREQCPDIRSFSAGNRQCCSLLRFVKSVQRNSINVHSTGGTFDGFALSCEFIQPFSVDGNRRIHGWQLGNIAEKLRQYGTKCCFCDVLFRIVLQGLSPDVERIGCLAKNNGCLIGLVLIRQDVAGFCCSSDQNWQYARCHWVECSCVSEPFHMQNATQLSDDIERGKILRFIHTENAVHDSAKLLSTAVCSCCMTDSAVPSMRQPAALM